MNFTNHPNDPPLERDPGDIMEEEVLVDLDDDSGLDQTRRSCLKRAEGLLYLKHLIFKYKPQILGLLEPKVSGASADSICKNLKFDNWIRIEAYGFSGGIWLLWNDPISLDILYTNPQFLLAQVKENSGETWNISVTVLNKEEVSCPRNFSQQRCVGFQNWMFNQGLLDMGFSGPKFTWHRGNTQDTFKAARLDRAVCNTEFQALWNIINVEHLPIIGSDHAPILVSFSNDNNFKGPKKFRFMAPWLIHPDFEKLVKENWKRDEPLRNNNENLARLLQSWNKEESGLIRLEKKLQKELNSLLDQEELKWFQKSRETWIASGDRNTKFYHASVLADRKRHKIGAITNSSGVLVADKQEIKNIIVDHFTRLFVKDREADLSLAIPGCFPTLEEEDWLNLNKPFTEEDIKKATFDMAPFKAPGPDGFIAAFYQNFWSSVGNSVSRQALNFFHTSKMDENLN
ncbi:uncharacterized protein LOC116024153 [Ipomoea triloba]|uniref:uncharacterized protein LOC116024153 n=1 Tax=Ipomoea triloba TaxID=35885 RepID=UPI00125D53DA|nr:uncharacterized protein LOC116024153 [Ipomoea triloba]